MKEDAPTAKWRWRGALGNRTGVDRKLDIIHVSNNVNFVSRYISLARDTHDVDAYLHNLPDNQPVVADSLLKFGLVLPIAFLQPATALFSSGKFGVEAGSLFLSGRNNRISRLKLKSELMDSSGEKPLTVENTV